MAKLRVGINGFGRIGRLVMRLGIQHPDIEFVAVNDLATTEDLAYLFNSMFKFLSDSAMN